MKKSTKIVLAIVCVAVICLLAAVLGWWTGRQNQKAAVNGENLQVTENMPTEAPEETEVPEVTEEPEETEVPEVTEEPGKTEVPEVTEAPEETEAPEVTEAPEKTKVPEVTEAPEGTEKPEDTTKPEETKEPEATEAPKATEPPKATQAPASTGISTLHVDGVNLCDESGNPVQLRGISTHGIAWFPQYVNESFFKEIKENWNANVVRLAMYTAENSGYCTDGNKDSLKNLVKNGVEYATNNDLYVIIDWHVLHDLNPNTYKEEAKKFFDEMSELYKDYPNVIFEICNEPNGGTSWKDVKSYAEEIIGVIRGNGANNIIIVGTPNWCQYVDQAAADPITSYDNIMYALHYYAATHKDDLRKKMVNAYNAGLPIFVSEYGICDASGNGGIDEKQANAWVDEMDKYGISYVAWSISNKNETASIFKSSCNKTSGFTWEDLSDSGKWLFTMLTGESGFTGTVPEVTGTQGTPNTPSQPANTPQAGSTNVVTGGSVEATLELKDSWMTDGGYCYNFAVTLKNTSDADIQNWVAEITFNENIALDQGWCGTYATNGNVLKITPADFNGTISAGQSISDIGFIIKGSANLQIVE